MRSDGPVSGQKPGTVALLMAAGQSRRFGATDKRTAPLPGGRTLLAASYQQLASVCPRIRVVLQSGETPETFGLPGPAPVIFAPNAAKGLGASLADAFCAISVDPALAHASSAAVCLGDMPLVTSATLESLMKASTADIIVRPALDGRPGHPVIIGRRFWAKMATLTGDNGGRQVLQQNLGHLRLIPVTDAGVLADVDTPEQLRNLTLRSEFS